MLLNNVAQAASLSMSSSLLVKAVMIWEHGGSVIERGARERVNACGACLSARCCRNGRFCGKSRPPESVEVV